MTPRHCARLLRYAAIQFIVLVGIAMAVYAGGSYWHAEDARYHVAGNFLSDLGMTRAWSGRANTASCVLFAIALTSVGLALIAFAWTWRHFAFVHQRARFAGTASAVLGTASGACFVGIAWTPFDLALAWHNGFVIAAFGLLLGYVLALTVVMAKNGATRAQSAINIADVALVLAYVALIFVGPRLGTEHGFRVQVIGQKVVALGSMAHVIVMTTLLLRVPSRPAAAPR